MGNRVGNEWRWWLSWRRNFFQWEIPIHQEFLDLIHQFVPSTREDEWVWRENREEGGFGFNYCIVNSG
jgi:hypothetical protein